MKKRKHHVYVLRCEKNGSYYTGYAINYQRRVQQHNAGRGAKYTRAFGPCTLLVAWEYTSRSVALRAEYQFKQLPRAVKVRYVHDPHAWVQDSVRCLGVAYSAPDRAP